jgi:hypothetical protein
MRFHSDGNQAYPPRVIDYANMTFGELFSPIAKSPRARRGQVQPK